MSIVEFNGGPINHRYLMNKSKNDLASMVMDYVRLFEKRMDLISHLHRQRKFSLNTFGPGDRTAGLLDHIRKELKEIVAEPHDLEEWVDLVLLALDGAWRAGHEPEAIAAGLEAKQTKNENRNWPDWRTADPDKAIEHVRDPSEDKIMSDCSGYTDMLDCQAGSKTAWIQTYTGQAFCPTNPEPATIDLLDIAHALSMICRFNGHTSRFYSVAEHCVRMSEEIPSGVAFLALMHDAAEAYIADIARPIKPLLVNYGEIEDRLLAVILARFGVEIGIGHDNALKTADLRMLATERLQLMAIHTPEWDSLRGIDPYQITLECWSPEEAKGRFLKRFAELSPGR